MFWISTECASPLEQHIDQEIDNYREIANTGKPIDAMDLLSSLKDRLPQNVSGRLLFRVKANISACLFALSRDKEGIALLFEACAHAPSEPKAQANLAMAYLMNGEWERTVEIGQNGLESDPSNEELAGYLVQALRFRETEHSPLDAVPEAIRSTKPVQIGYLFFLRQREVRPNWWTFAHELAELYPDDEFVVQASAEATLDRILIDEKVVSRHGVPASEIDELNAAKSALLRLWRKFDESQRELKSEYFGLATNLVLCCDLLSDVETVKNLVEGKHAALLLDDAFAIRVAQMAFNLGEHDLFGRSLASVQSERPKFHFTFYNALQKKDWEQILELKPKINDLAEDHERELFSFAAEIAEVMSFKGEISVSKFVTLSNNIKDDARSFILLLNSMDEKGFFEEAELIFLKARERIAASEEGAARAMFAHFAYKKRDWHTIIQMLSGHIDQERDNDELRLLATAFVNASPATRSAVAFFKRLPDDISETNYYVEREAVFHFNRGALAQAERCYRNAINRSETPELGYYLPLLSVLLRAQKHKKIEETIDEMLNLELRGEAQDKATFAHALMSHGHPERAMRLAYEALSENAGSPEVHAAFCTLVLMNTRTGKNELVVPSATKVGSDVWVMLRSDSGDHLEFLVSDSPDQEAKHLFSKIFPHDHLFTNACLEQGCGHTFKGANAFGGPDISWEIVEVQHKYGRACRTIMDEFSRRFPGSTIMGSLQSVGENVQPILDFIRERSERIQSQADFYVNQGFPISVVASMLNNTAIEFAHGVRNDGHPIKTCNGNNAERQNAMQLIDEKRMHGVVIDAYTAWTIATLKAFEVVKSVFGQVHIAQSCFDEITKMLVEAENNQDDSFGVHWKDGNFYKEERTAEEALGQACFIRDVHEQVNENCEILPGEAPDEIPEVSRELIESFSPDLLDAAFCASDDKLLLTEDLAYRLLAKQEINCEGVWLQSVFMYAAAHGMLNANDYCKFTVGLAYRNHSHLSVQGAVLAQIAINRADFELADFSAIANFLGTKDADVFSHFSVASDCIGLIWAERSLSLPEKKSTCSIVLRNLIRFRKEDWQDILAVIYINATRNLRAFITNWVSGHFLPAENFSDAVSTALSIRHNEN
ncbi:hypothetical protein QTO30_10280 [Yoonia sp. GPGPB17]|uniref:PIN domain-containing protein n=1 Tax=Yoonia sp. GPGPB17 TaxID=3026147 RepID=UPI0030C37744